MKWNVVPMFAFVGLALLITAVASGAPERSGAKKVKVALVLPCSTNDGSWCQQAYVAAKQLQKEGAIDLKVTSNAPQDTAAVSQLLARYAQQGTQLVLAHSAWQDATTAAASKFPKTAFAFAGGGKTGANVATYEEPIYQPAYLAGILASGISKTGVLGGLAALDIPLCHAQMEAFRLGAQKYRSGMKQVTTYIGDFNDAAKAKEAALAEAGQKADVFISCGGGPAEGMISAIKANNLSGFGYVGNQNALAPKNLVGSLVYNLYPIFKAIVADVANGKFKGKSYDLGLSSFNLQINSKYGVTKIPAKTMAQMKAAEKAILSGKLKVPYVTG